jgi:hypothetical protein
MSPGVDMKDRGMDAPEQVWGDITRRQLMTPKSVKAFERRRDVVDETGSAGRRPRRTNGGRWLTRAVPSSCVLVALVVGLMTVSAGSAMAVGGYSAAGSGLALRSQPNTSSAVLARFGAGQMLDVQCQIAGQNINGSTIWDKITGTNGYVADFFVNGTPYAQFDSNIPRCDVPSAPAPGPAAAPTSTWRCSWPRCELYLNREASVRFADFGWSPETPAGMYGALWRLGTTAYRGIGHLWVERGYCLAFQLSAYPWETQGMWGYRC